MGSMFYKTEQTIDFAQVEDIKNIKELILHDCTISNFSCITAAKTLKSIALVNCNITSEDLSCLKEMEKLKTIMLNVMRLDGILCLADIAPLKELSLRAMEGINYAELEHFTKLQDLCIEETEVPSFDFMKKLKNLKKLTFHDVPINSLDFLYDLPKLKEFTMEYRADDEKALECVSGMKYLQRFHYPVADMEIYKGCPKITSIGIDCKRAENLSALAGNETINDVMFYNLPSKEQYKQQLAELKQYLSLTSYGYVGE